MGLGFWHRAYLHRINQRLLPARLDCSVDILAQTGDKGFLWQVSGSAATTTSARNLLSDGQDPSRSPGKNDRQPLSSMIKRGNSDDLINWSRVN